MQNATVDTPHVHFAVLGDRRNGVERLSLIGTLDRSTVAILEREVDDVSHAEGAVVLDLHNLDVVDIDAVRALEAMARSAADGGRLLFIVHGREPSGKRSSGTGPPISSAAMSRRSCPPGMVIGRRSRCPRCPGSA